MELRQLRYLVAAAEAGNFTRAAGSTHHSQPNLSRQIRLLEDELGVRLFERGASGAQLTHAGRAFLVRARQALAALDGAQAELRPYRADQDGYLRVGAPGVPHTEALFQQFLSDFRVDSAVRLVCVSLPFLHQWEGLRSGTLDVGFGISAGDDDDPDVQALRIVDDSSDHALLTESHPLAARPLVGPEQLDHLPVVVAPPTALPKWHRLQLAELRSAGYMSPVASTPTTSFTDALDLVAAGGCWLFTSRRIARQPPAGTRAVPLAGIDLPTGYDVLWRRGDTRPSVRDFVSVCARVARRWAR